MAGAPQSCPEPKGRLERGHARRAPLATALWTLRPSAPGWEGAVEACTRALALQPDSAKALYRRGVARSELLQFGEAKADLLQACKLEPRSREIREQFDRTKAAHAQAKATDKAAFGGVLG